MLGEALLLGSAGIFSPIVGQGIYNRRKEASERIQDLEAELQELDEDAAFTLETGRKWLDGDRLALSSKTLEATVEVDADFVQYDSVEEAIEEEEYLEDLGQGVLSSMVAEYEPFDSPIDRYSISFDGEAGSLSYSLPDTEFVESFNDEGERELRSSEEVYQETFGEEDYTSLN